MTRMQIARRRLRIRWQSLGWKTFAFAIAGVIAMAALLASSLQWLVAPASAPTNYASVVLIPVKASALLDLTVGAHADAVAATGVAAEQINAALPFSAAPVQAARPFDAPSGGTDYDRALTCLTQAVYYEAGFEPIEGRRAVAQVILNRIRHPAFPKSVCGVIYQRNATPVCQFSFVCDGALGRSAAAGPWAEARRVAQAALAGYVEASVGQATHYHANYVSPRWAPLLAKITNIGAHIFYRWPGTWGQPAAFTGRYIGEPNDPSSLRVPLRPAVQLAAVLAADGTLVGPAVTALVDPTVHRAASDVGGLLDTSKGWTLNIPLPGQAGGAAKAIAERQAAPSPNPITAIALVAVNGGPSLAAK